MYGQVCVILLNKQQNLVKSRLTAIFCNNKVPITNMETSNTPPTNSTEVIFLGGCFRDLVACSERFPKVGETIVGTKFHMGFGGKAANAAVMCSRLGGKTNLRLNFQVY